MEQRDKLFTKEQYIKQLAKYTTRIEKFNSIIEQSEKNGDEQINPDFYGRLFDCRVNSIVTMYSMGEKLESIKSDYILTIKVLKKCWTPYGYYVQMLWLLSIAIMLDYEDDIIQELYNMIENNGVKDHIYDILLNYKFSSHREFSKCVFDDIPYHAILDVTSLAQQDKSLAVQRLKKYLAKEWYRGHSDCAWYNDHKYGIIHDGYWSFESGALVKVLGLDDSILKGQPYYPYDMVHWADSQK
uniref:PoNe immunity protein domain-containing protein n=1 Tax=Bacteroides xylanisolvens TaxID=371601 RepID=UPI003566306C